MVTKPQIQDHDTVESNSGTESALQDHAHADSDLAGFDNAIVVEQVGASDPTSDDDDEAKSTPARRSIIDGSLSDELRQKRYLLFAIVIVVAVALQVWVLF